jgi:hypothetical protein
MLRERYAPMNVFDLVPTLRLELDPMLAHWITGSMTTPRSKWSTPTCPSVVHQSQTVPPPAHSWSQGRAGGSAGLHWREKWLCFSYTLTHRVTRRGGEIMYTHPP